MKIENLKAQELEHIRAAHGGLLKPEDVVDFARDPNTALHSEFEWDDSLAAHEHRLNQARNVIRLVVTIIGEQPEPVRAFVSLPTDRVSGGGYRSMADVVNDVSRRDEMIRDALERLLAAKRKYQHLVALQDVWMAIDAAVAKQQEEAPSAATG